MTADHKCSIAFCDPTGYVLLCIKYKKWIAINKVENIKEVKYTKRNPHRIKYMKKTLGVC